MTQSDAQERFFTLLGSVMETSGNIGYSDRSAGPIASEPEHVIKASLVLGATQNWKSFTSPNK